MTRTAEYLFFSLLTESPLFSIASSLLGMALAALYPVFWPAFIIGVRKRPEPAAVKRAS